MGPVFPALLTLLSHFGSEMGLGYLPDTLLASDQPVQLVKAVASLPDASEDWHLSPVTSNQLSIGSCVGNAVADAKEDLDFRAGLEVEWSRLFAYLGGRLTLNGLTLGDYLVNRVSTHTRMLVDSGSRVRDVVAFSNAEGLMSEALWPYIISEFAELPDVVALNQAKRHRLLSMRYLSSAEELRVSLHEKKPVVLGFRVYSSFADVGIDGNYRIGSGPIRGGHCVRAVKHVKSKVVPGFRPGASLMRNSWGLDWGTPHPTMSAQIPGRGFFWLPDEVIDSNDVDDIWALEATTNAE